MSQYDKTDEPTLKILVRHLKHPHSPEVFCGHRNLAMYSLRIVLQAFPSTRQHPSHGDCVEVKRNIIRTALCWIVWHNVHSLQHTYVSSSYRSNRLGLSHCDPYTVRRSSCLELYYCNMVEWFWCDSSLISTSNWFPSVLWHCWFGHLAFKNRPWNEL